MKDSLTVGCTRTILRSVRSFVSDVLIKIGLSDLDVNMLVLAVDEVCSNLIIHSHSCNPERHITLEIRTDEEGIYFDIMDEGKLFNFMNYEEPTIDQLVQDQRKGGMGIILVKRIMDNIEFFRDENRNVIRLYKKFSGKMASSA